MAEEHGGQQGSSWPWLKLFSAFKIAILPSKLFLAALGILVMALGWNILGWIFISMRSEPQWAKDKYTNWKAFKEAHASWNLMNEMAGSTERKNDAEDVAKSEQEYQEIKKIMEEDTRFHSPITVTTKKEENQLEVGKESYSFTATPEALEKLKEKKLKVGQLTVQYIPQQVEKTKDGKVERVIQKEETVIILDGIPVTLTNPKQGPTLKEFRDGAKNAKQNLNDQAPSAKTAFDLIDNPTYKPYGYLRAWPWSEYRGPNPFLVMTEPKYREEYVSGILKTQVPVLLEPLAKFFSPIAYFLHPNATFGIRFYLLFVILWTLATWALFGGAITRIAVVQAARPNEKVGMIEAIRFARSRLQSLFSAPLIPLFFLAFLTFIALFLGEIMGLIPWLGDVLAFLFWPLIFIIGLIMAIVLVGLIGWPLMYATISAEGSDSFDALSRSYSYVFQGIWRYLWYCLVAVAYGVVLVFFVTLMGSLMVYMGKWGASQAPFLTSDKVANDRDPTYFFVHAPQSFGWRNLLLYGSQYKTEKTVIRQNGQKATEITMNEEYQKEFHWNNALGAFLVSIWLYLLFLMMLGFSYSYFWTATSIIYLLMRKYVDDTEFDEIHLDEDEEEPMPEMPVSVPKDPGSAPPAPASPGFTLVDPPTLRSPNPAPVEPPPPAPPRSANPTMLARDEPPQEPGPLDSVPPPPENPPPPNSGQ